MVDLPGCGNSGCPNPTTLPPDGYSPTALAERVLQALDTHLADRDPKQRITLVGHSLGGTIAIRMMGSLPLRTRYDRLLRHVDRMVLLAPADAFVNPSPEILRLAEVSGLEVEIAALLGILQLTFDEATVRGVDNPDRALREEAERLCRILRQPRTRLALQAMLLQAVPRGPDGRVDWPAIARIEADYANVGVPCLIVWGRRDEVLPEAMGHKIADQIPTAELYVVEHCKHSVHLECPRLCADIIGRFTAAPTAWNDALTPDRIFATSTDGQPNPLVSGPRRDDERGLP
jgi:pimeloyl-ACP methyl ester carboxylesterase